MARLAPKMIKTMAALAAAAVFLPQPQAQAVTTLAKYNLDNAGDNQIALAESTGNFSDAVDFLGDGVTASDISAVQTTALGFGYDDAITPNPDVNSVTSDDPGNLNNNSEDGHTWWGRGTTLPNALDIVNGPYVEFTIAADTAANIDFAGGTVDLRYALHDRNVGGTYNANVALYSVDNAGVLTGLDLGTVDNNNRNYVYQTLSLDASALGITQSATLRLYFTDNSGVTGKHTILDSVTVNATAIPEPATASMLGLVGLALVSRRRRTI